MGVINQNDIVVLRQRLLAKGYYPLPLRGKLPDVLKGWQKKTDTNPAEIRTWGNVWPDASNTGALTKNTPTLDIDVTHTEAAEAIEALAKERFEDRGFILTRIGNAPKRAIPFRTDSPFPKLVVNLTGPDGSTHKIELLCDGQQFVVDGIHPDTRQPYSWHGGEPWTVKHADLPHISQDEARQLIDDAADLLVREFGFKRADKLNGNGKPKSNGTGETKSFTFLGIELDCEQQWERPDDYIDLMDKIRSGESYHDALVKLSARFAGSGMSEPAIVALLQDLMNASDADKDDRWTARYNDIERIVRTAWEKYGPKIEDDPPSIIPNQAPQKTLSAETEPVAKEPDEPLLPYASNVPGLVGEIIDYVTATARRPNAVLALGTAVSVIGTLIGRRVAGPTRSATHLYTVGVAPTGNGKQHVLDSAARLLKAAGASEHIGPAKFFSLSAMIDMLASKPLMLCLQDEVGVFLAAITDRRAGSHEKAVSQTLRTLWGTSFGVMPPPAWAGRPMALISCPAVSLLGVSTPDEFYKSLQGDSISNGFLNRFLVLQSNIRAADVHPRSPEVPAGLAEALRQLYLWSGPASLIQIANPAAELEPDVLPWASTGAQAVFDDLVREVERRTDNDASIVPYVARCAEIAVRLATIRAAGRWGNGAAVGADDMQWAASLAWVAGQAMAGAVIDIVPQNERGAFVDKLLEIIRRRGTVRARDIQQAIKGRLRSSEIKDIVRQLIEAGEVECLPDGSCRAVNK
jgi:hypothetical protein